MAIPDDNPFGVEVYYGEFEFKLLTIPNLLIMNAVLGLLLFEWAWYKTYKVRNPIQELDDIFPAYRRRDAPKWQKWRFYPGAITLLLPRMILAILGGISLTIFINVTMVGA